ncbi:MAG: hypothetical protein IJQ12_03440 [Lachnospiraceae bacterium]|nr:hypothetical protein [Lachnospiraceae bacterium]
MGLVAFKQGSVLHTKTTDLVQTMEILLKGSITMDNGFYTLSARGGAILGLAERPKASYEFTYQAATDCQVLQLPYTSAQDIVAAVHANKNICPHIAAECVRLACEALNMRAQKLSHVQEAYERIVGDYADYPDLCAQLGEYPKSFDEIKHLSPPVLADGIQDWEIDTMRSAHEQAEALRKNVYAVSPALSVGIIMSTVKYYNAVSDSYKQTYGYEEELRNDSNAFMSEMHLMRARAVEKERATFEGDATDAPKIENALDTILSYAGADNQVTEEFREKMLAFRENPNRYSTNDEERMFRRNLGKLFYDIYFAAFLRSRDNPAAVPSEVRMLFMFGFIDEVLAGEEHTAMLYSIVRNYTSDPKDRVITAYEWLTKIYNGEVAPSKNEFDQDYPTYLRELKTSGDVTEDKMKQMADDPKEKFLFEAKNLFTIGGRVTFGHAATFVPFFDRLNVSRPLAKAYVNAEVMDAIFDHIRSVDFGLFSRQHSFSRPDLGINQLFLDEVVMPYVILTPVIGCRGNLWQEIEGRDRMTPARMLLPVFFTEDLNLCVLNLSAEFRWEMCKTVQGVHWNDVTDPSLTALYCDYLQFYKKNRTLSEENKEKVKTTLKKYQNDYKKVFMGDYATYINFEANESPRLNKIAREILFTFLPFPKEMRDKMADNPQYRDLIKKYQTQQANKVRPLAGIINKLKKDGMEVPPELMRQYQELQK